MLDLLLTTATDSTFDRMMHPFGDMRTTRWVIFGAAFLLWAMYPLLYARAWRRAETAALESASVTGGRAQLNIRLGWSWLVIGLAGLGLLAAALALPYTYADLEWKVFDPFAPGGGARTITFLLVIPGILLIAGLQYWLIRRPTPQPLRLTLAGTRALALWMIFIIFCAPYTTSSRAEEVPYRSIVLLDDSLSMGEAVREFAVASPLELGEELVTMLTRSNDPADRTLLDNLNAATERDRRESEAMSEQIDRFGMPKPGQVRYETSDVELVDFEMRSFVRKIVIRRAERLKAKIAALHGKEIDLRAWKRREAEISRLRREIRAKEDEIAAELQRETPSSATLSVAQTALARLQTDLDGATRAHTSAIEDGSIVAGLTARLRAASGEEARRLTEARQRVLVAVRNAVRNLLSTLDDHGPTRWDIASEILQPGNTATIQEMRGLRLIDLALAPMSGQLSLLDLLRRNREGQPDRLPADLVEIAELAGIKVPVSFIPPPTDAMIGDRLTMHTFSEADPGRGTAGVLRQVTPEELDFLRPEGRTSQVFAAYIAALRGETQGELATVLVISDGHDTSRAANAERQRATELLEALTSQEDGPTVITMAVGHPRPERVLQLLSITGDDEVLLDEVVTLNLNVRANANWKDVEVILCEGNLSNEIPYDDIDGVQGRTKIDVVADAGGGFRTTSFKLRFKPKVGGRTTYTVKLNRRRLPGEDTYENNVVSKDLNVIDRKIRVLFIDHSFRWEARYLMEALIRDKALEVHTFIIDADNGWPQKRSEYNAKVRLDMPPLRAPFAKMVNPGTAQAATAQANTADEWFGMNYDVVIMGDVNPQEITYRRVKWLNEWVTQKRGGIIWLAGHRHNPSSYTDPDLAELLPIIVGRSGAYDGVDTTALKHFGLTLAGRNDEVVRFTTDTKRQEELWGRVGLSGFFAKGQLDGFYWYSKVAGPRDASSTVIAAVAEHDKKFEDPSLGGGDPLIVSRHVGTGRSLFIGTDEIWRFRRFWGDFYYYRFWQNAIRWAATSRLKAKKDGIDLRTDEPKYLLDQQVTVFCDLLGDSEQFRKISSGQQEQVRRHTDGQPPQGDKRRLLVRWRNTMPTRTGGASVEGFDDGNLLLEETSPNHFEGTLYPNTIGKYELSVVGEPVTTKNPAIFFVEASSEQQAELRETEVNADILRMLASRERLSSDAPTDGVETATRPRFVRFFEAERVNPDLRTKTVERDRSEREAFSLLELMLLLVGLFGAEWFVRKLSRLP